MEICHAALLDELVKIAENKPSGGFGSAAKSMGVAALGGAAGYGAAELLGRKLKFFNQVQAPTTEAAKKILDRRLTAAKIILPALSGTAVMLADRYRKKLSDEYSKVKGYKDPFGGSHERGQNS